MERTSTSDGGQRCESSREAKVEGLAVSGVHWGRDGVVELVLLSAVFSAVVVCTMEGSSMVDGREIDREWCASVCV